MMKVLIADKLSGDVVTALEELGLDVQVQPDMSSDDLIAALRETHILIVRSTRVSAAAVEAAPQLSLIVRAGAGVNTIDMASASARGVYVANCPGKNTAAVAELTIGLLIAVDRGIADATAALRSGAWQKKRFGNARGLKGRTLGVLGFGEIGRAVARRAAGLEMQTIAWSRSLTREIAVEHEVAHASSPEELAAASDVVSVHLALTPETVHLVAARFFEAMKPGTIFINTSRGELVDTAALKKAVADKGLRVGLDVFENEPSSGEAAFEDLELATLATCTPHIGASTDEASEAIAAEVVRIVTSFVTTGRVPGAVNLCARSPATHHLVVRHFNRVGVLAGVMDALREEGINVEEMENIIFEGALAACCTLRLDRAPSNKLMAALRRDTNILHVLLEANS
jgi:D-3-phosphoglycerate dehydrogenase